MNRGTQRRPHSPGVVLDSVVHLFAVLPVVLLVVSPVVLLVVSLVYLLVKSLVCHLAFLGFGLVSSAELGPLPAM